MLELRDYIDSSSDEKLEEMYALIKNEKAGPYEWWKDEELVAELERRSADLKSGKDKGFTWEEPRAHLLDSRNK
jgi:putative addiction module component (TIGR02574 family)